jgi:hypothetical protein
MSDTGLTNRPFQLEISDLSVTTRPGERTLISYHLTNKGPQEMPVAGAFVRAVAAARSGALADQSHWYERPLAAGQGEDLVIHLETFIDPGTYGVTLQIADPQGNLITQTEPVVHEVPALPGSAPTTGTLSDAPYFLQLHIMEVTNVAGGLHVHIKAVNSGGADAPPGTELTLSAARASDGVHMATETHPLVNPVPAGSHLDGDLALVLDPGHYRLEIASPDPSRVKPDVTEATVT